MIRYLIHRPTTDGKVYAVIAGLSNDTKPTAGLITGSRFVAADTGARYMFDESAGQWNETQFQDQIDAAVQAWLDDHPEAIDQAAIEAMFGDQLDGIEEDLGGLKSAITHYNSYNKIPINPITATVNGVTYTSNGDGSYTANGTAASNAQYNVYNEANNLPNGIKAGEPVTFEFSTNGDEGFLQIYPYVNGTLPSSPLITIYVTETYTVTLPSGTTGLLIRYRVPSGKTVSNLTFSLTVFSEKTNKKLNEELTLISEKTINLFDIDNTKWTNHSSTIEKLADDKTLRVTSTTTGTNSYSWCYIDVTDINTIYVQADTCVCSIPQQTTTPRIRIGKLKADLTFDRWLDDTQYGKSIDVSNCKYIMVALYAIYTVSSPEGTYVDYTNIMITNGDIKKPFVESGLTAVDKISRTPFIIPDYYFASHYLENKIDRINALCEGCMGNGDAFIFMTDQHWRLNAQNSPALVKYIFDNTNINRMFMGGDLCNGGSDLNFFTAQKSYANAFGGEINYAVGNHDYLSTQLNDNKLSYWMYTKNNNRVYGDYDRHYYYIDNTVQKIRYIVLSAYQYSGSSSRSVIGYELEQQTWLQTTALGTLESGWTAIIITHLLYLITAGETQDTDTLSLPTECDAIADIIANYNGSAEIACVIQGHTHLDKITSVKNSGIPVVATTCDKYVIGTATQGTTDIPRVDRVHATITEQAFDVVILDKTNKKFTFVRIGAPALNGVDSAWGTEVQEREVTY